MGLQETVYIGVYCE